MSPDYRHYLCDYRIEISARFAELEAAKIDAEKGADKGAENAEAPANPQ